VKYLLLLPLFLLPLVAFQPGGVAPPTVTGPDAAVVVDAGVDAAQPRKKAKELQQLLQQYKKIK